MTDQAGTTGGSDFKDRKTGLLLFGILHIVFGGLCALAVPLMLFAMMMSGVVAQKKGAQPMSAGTMIPGILLYVLLAVWFLWMGIGSIKARRWARALILVSSWVWLISGIIGFVLIAILMPGVYAQMAKNGQMPAAMAQGMTIIMLGFLLVLYVIVPGALALFYGSRHVKATCEQRDPQVRWTDKCPLPVLAVSLLFGFATLAMPLTGFYGWALPFFGAILTGATGAAVALVVMVLCGYVAWGAYHLKVHAWWAAVLVVIAWGVSTGITFSRVSLMDLFAKMNYTAEQLEMMKSVMPHQSALFIVSGLWVVAALGYLIYTRRFFAQPLPLED